MFYENTGSEVGLAFNKPRRRNAWRFTRKPLSAMHV